MTSNHSLLTILHDHALAHGDSIAHLLSDRVITYRRFWSRIERASARLQGEWEVKTGDIVIYWGLGHPDAIILYCALLRIGAKLLPCEDCDAEVVERMVKKMHCQLVVHDDALSFPVGEAKSLSALLADWCHFDPVVMEDESSTPTLYLPNLSGNNEEALSLGELMQDIAVLDQDEIDKVIRVDGSIFLKDKLTQLILPALIARRRFLFSSIESL